MKKRILIVLGILIAAGAIGAGVWYYKNNGAQEPGGDKVTYVTTVSSLTGESTGVMNRFAGVVEPQETLKVEIENGRKVKEVQVKEGEEVKKGQLLFVYDLSSIQDELQQAKLELDRLKNEANSLKEQIYDLTKEKKKAKQNAQLSYTIEIKTNEMNLKKNEYEQKSKVAEIEKLQGATGNTEVRSEIEGVIQKIDVTKMSSDDGDYMDESMSYDFGGGGNDDSNAFITILSTGAYRIKGKVNEQNRSFVVPGEPVIIRSRVNSDQTWRGTMGNIDTQNGSGDSNGNNMYYGMMSTDDEQTNSTSYPFYVELEESKGLMLGQHVYIERDLGQDSEKKGLWLSDYYIVDADSENPYVWAADAKKRLEKRYVTLGKHDDELFEYEIVDGITKDDCIAFPTDALEEGTPVKIGEISQMMGADAYGGAEDFGDFDEMPPEDGEMQMYGEDAPGPDEIYNMDEMEPMEDMQFLDDEGLDFDMGMDEEMQMAPDMSGGAGDSQMMEGFEE